MSEKTNPEKFDTDKAAQFEFTKNSRDEIGMHRVLYVIRRKADDSFVDSNWNQSWIIEVLDSCRKEFISKSESLRNLLNDQVIPHDDVKDPKATSYKLEHNQGLLPLIILLQFLHRYLTVNIIFSFIMTIKNHFSGRGVSRSKVFQV